ncbi:gas vesicle protein GvpM [Halobiforma nitratireducens]|uniref:Gas vesicle protein GVPa n=1 Tax=Halobiforma nitratireducens JCM 10879 TaxID=1227454 RepID=M0M7R2_9EURY|nr:gas vesicle protein [Halobiforma nitratireducens]EMA41852.1 gas vesicle protein GVPa [Halobiforma nitratireducens JCM 10879]
MRPRKDDEALVDVIDVLLRDGAVLRADMIVSVAEIPLVGIKLTAAIAGMKTMTEYGFFEEWDARHRRRHESGSESVAVGSNGRAPLAEPETQPESEGHDGDDGPDQVVDDVSERIDWNDEQE